MKIPKIIHYCWFGNMPKPTIVNRCIESWRKFCSDYKIIEWNETSFDVHSTQYVKEAYTAQKWAFITDYVRLYALYTYGGIYLDSDVEILQPIDSFLEEDAFSGFESRDSPVTAIMGCIKRQKLFGELLSYYDSRSFLNTDGYDLTPNTVIITRMLAKRGIELNGKKQIVDGCTIYPEITFCPNTFSMIFYHYSNKSYATHHFMGSWGANAKVSERKLLQRIRLYLVRKARNIFGTSMIGKVSKTIKEI